MKDLETAATRLFADLRAAINKRPDAAYGSELAGRKEQREQKRSAMRKEALQVAAMAVRFIEDVCDRK